MKKVLVDQFSIDASAKAPKKLTQYNGKQLYEALQSRMNEIGQFCTQVLAESDSHEQLEPALNAMQQQLKEKGKHGPHVAFTDNP
jgi:type II secretory pathway component PulF